MRGTTNAVSYLLSSLAAALPRELEEMMLKWLDDILLHASDMDDFLEGLERFLKFCLEHNLRLHPKKCTLFTKSVKWCGRIISEEGVTFNPRGKEALLQMQPPTKGGQLQQFVCALQWIKASIPEFAQLIEPLLLFMERVYDASTGRRKSAVVRDRPGEHWMGRRRVDSD